MNAVGLSMIIIFMTKGYPGYYFVIIKLVMFFIFYYFISASYLRLKYVIRYNLLIEVLEELESDFKK